MKKFFIYIGLIFGVSISIYSQKNYDDYFTDNSLRIDIYHCGNTNTEAVFFKELLKEKIWAGTKKNLINSFDFGTYQVRVYEKNSGVLIFSYGYCSLFGEYIHTEQAKNISKCFPESLIIPFPKDRVLIELHSRKFDDNKFYKIWEIEFDPKKDLIKEEIVYNYKSYDISINANISEGMDIVFIGDGYTFDNEESFLSDVNATVKYFLNTEPFNNFTSKINIRAVLPNSVESGTDMPHLNEYKNTTLGTSFNTFGSERYLTLYDYHILRDYSSNVPCDHICVLVNTDTYGGGGIYNFWNVTAAKNPYRNEIFMHELGHSLAGLGDEYFDSEVSTEDMYNLNTEPWEANITTLVNFDSKWKNMIKKDIPIPTPAEKKYFSEIGVFEGASYKSKGLYRPFINCKMKSLGVEFCPVCQKTLSDVIKYYCE
jgi:hypothetical protein